MKRHVAVFVVMLLAAGAVRIAAQRADADQMRKGAALPAGWQVRLDNGSTQPTGIQFMTMGSGFHVMTGPAAIFYRADMTKSGSYQAQATFQQMEAAAHPEAYGLFIGGSDLAGANQKYTYFLIRQDGKFLIKKRAGATTPNVQDWTDNAAVKKTEGATKGTNTLAVAVGPDKVRFLVNGTEVHAAAANQVDTSGIVGLRVNHNLNVHVDNFSAK
jgi:hypothetical protein